MGKKKFIDKKNSATFRLLARDSSTVSTEGGAPALSDRVFVRVDNNPYSSRYFLDEEDEQQNVYPNGGDSDSIFADAHDDTGDGDFSGSLQPWVADSAPRSGSGGGLPEHVRKEILELGFPDDGYNYLNHLREIRNTGSGYTYYQNSKARLDLVPQDVKAYDASKLRVSGEEGSGDAMYTVAAKSVGVKVQRVLDPDVVRLLDDDDLSRFGSDVEDLEEDFVVQANCPPEGEDQGEVEHVSGASVRQENIMEEGDDASGEASFADEFIQKDKFGGVEKPRVRRLLDEQFDLLTLREYDTESESDDAAYADIEDEPLASKLSSALKGHAIDDLDLEDSYKAPGDFFNGNEESGTGREPDEPADVIRKCVEYAEMYYHENHEDEEVVVLVAESSDESEVWDCETIVSTYSNLDNHPGKIQAPSNRKKKLPENLSGDAVSKSNIIALRGKEKLPVDFLPHNKRAAENSKRTVIAEVNKPNRRPRGEESKEEKKERKATIKEEKREAHV
ncbi:hypothetical protein J5N97_014197 [Dioscorea zingiberensis]|uniref:Low temperature viability protein n=1 Tax=Dioscorea zingiberensis TaxID=325984 RepID=A0A9D5HJJ9_9LILI|nr:hypothetical protein J5N97_014197 [Dioscorea zingiberensis]